MNYVQLFVILLKNRVWQSIIQSKFYIMEEALKRLSKKETLQRRKVI